MLRHNFIVAVTTFAVCLLGMPVYEWMHTRSWSSRRKLRGSDSQILQEDHAAVNFYSLLHVDHTKIVLPGLSSSLERTEASRRVRFWMEVMDSCQRSFFGKRRTRRICGAVSGAQALVQLLMKDQELRPQAETSLHKAPLLIASSWLGSVPTRMLNQAADQFSVDLHPHSINAVLVGSETSCRPLQALLNRESSFAKTVRCAPSDMSIGTSPNSYEWISASGCVSYTDCAFQSATPSRITNAVNDTVLAHVANSPDVVVVDLEASSIALTATITETYCRRMRSLGRGSLLVAWRTHAATREGSSVKRWMDVFVKQCRHPDLVPYALHGDCISRAPASLDYVSAPFDALLSTMNSSTAPTQGFGDASMACLFLLRHSHDDEAHPLATILTASSSAVKLRGLDDKDGEAEGAMIAAATGSAVGVSSNALTLLLSVLALCVGAVLCYGISKNWIKKRRHAVSGFRGRTGVV